MNMNSDNDNIISIPIMVNHSNTVDRYMLVKISKTVMEDVLEWLEMEAMGKEERPKGIRLEYVERHRSDPEDFLREINGNPNTYATMVHNLTDELERSGSATVEDMHRGKSEDAPLSQDAEIVRFKVESGFSAKLGCGTAGEVLITSIGVHGYVTKG